MEPQLYRINYPAGLVAAQAAPLLWAKVCERVKGSRYATQGCRRWEPVANGGIMSGSGDFRLVGKKAGVPKSFVYTVSDPFISESGTAPKVPVNPEN